jgi:sulfur carrier protein ThiS
VLAIRVKILETNTVVEVEREKLTVKELLEYLKLSSSENLVLKGTTILTEEDELVNGEEVVVFTVKSGG